jgi:hypothetical protein
MKTKAVLDIFCIHGKKNFSLLWNYWRILEKLEIKYAFNRRNMVTYKVE